MSDQLCELIQAVRENTKTFARCNTYKAMNPTLVLPDETGDQLAVLIRSIKANTFVIMQSEDYRINNHRLVAGICQTYTLPFGALTVTGA